MGIPGSANPLLLASAAPTGYTIERSLRFNSADSAYLSRTPASAGNRKTWTWAAWVKRSGTGTFQELFGAGSNNLDFSFNSDNLTLYEYNGSTTLWQRTTAAVYRDFSSWYHIVLVVDTTQATAANRMRLYVNGNEVTVFSVSTNPTQNSDTYVNSTIAHYIGRQSINNRYLDAYLADVHLIDGQALTPTSFGEFDVNNVWQPKAYTGSYGTNGFQLKFADNSAATAAALGADSSGNGNNWTPNNLSVTAGAGNDSLVDTPTNYGTDTGVGAEVRGNYCTYNPLVFSAPTLSNGNLDAPGNGSSWQSAFGSIQMPASGKWYWEVIVGHGDTIVGVSKTFPTSNTFLGGWADSYGWYGGVGRKTQGPSNTQTNYASFAASDVIGVAYDAGAGSLTFYKNGASQGSAFTGLTGEFYPVLSTFGAATSSSNFGQRPFAFPLSGFKALCTANLPTPTITKPSTVMDVVTYTGTGSSLTPTSTLGFSPDLVWIKSRSAATDNTLYDSVRGAQARLESNTTDAEVTSDNGLTAFNSNGFTLGTLAQVNTNAATYAGWAFDAGSSSVTNTSGSISSQVRASVSSGFSVVTYTSGAAGSTIGHGLGVTPALILAKSRSLATGWAVYHTSLGNGALLVLNDTSAVNTSQPGYWGTPNSSTFGVSTNGFFNNNGNMVAYCFAPVANYSAFGSYQGNGSADGPFVFLGFRPAVVIVKMSSSTGNWTILDDKREGYNVDNDPLFPNLSNAEGTTDLIDITSNGFKVRTTDATFNTNAATYVYAAWASSPFAYARAR